MSKDGKAKTSSKKSRARVRRAIALLAFITACLVTVLILLPPGEEGAGPARGRPAEPSAERVEPDTVEGPPAEAPEASEERRAAEAAISGRREGPFPIAVVIDDVGYSLEQLEPFLDFHGPITLSVLPNLPYSRESARRITEAGKELLLHLPMEALNGNDPGPGAIRTSQSEQEIRRLLESSFSQVPQAVGMNNHMGSRATADERVMNVVMDYLSTNRCFFLDSRTTPASVGAATAAAHAVPFLERNVFLDNEPRAEAIRQALENGVEVARKQGYAIMIGHVSNPQIVDVIGGLAEELERAGVKLVPLSALLEEGGS
jgi:polysaccharide deacetylase 2 family uncharacterized protein YibQ